MAKQYWSQRKGLVANIKYDFSNVKISVKAIIDDFTKRGVVC
jgi:hypothetical protein